MTARWGVVRKLGLGLGSRSGGGGAVGLFSLCRRRISNITTPTLDNKKVAASPATSSPRQRSSFPILMVPCPDTGTGSEKDEKPDDDDYYHYFHLADYEDPEGNDYYRYFHLPDIEKEEKLFPWPKVRRIKKNKIPGVPNYDLAQCVGSSHGWLAFTDHPNPNINSSISFVNPFASEQKPNHFQLPPIPMESGGGGGGVPFVQKVALSSPPCEDTCIMAAAIHGGPRHNLAFYKHKPTHDHEKEKATWWIPGGDVGDYSDVVYSQKDGIFYAIRNPQPNDKVTDYPIEAWDPCSHQFTLIHPSFNSPYPHVLKNFEDELDEKRYLVESSRGGGDLYLICRYIAKTVDEGHFSFTDKDADEPGVYRTVLFRAYKLNRVEMCWVDVGEMEDEAFFVGMNHTFSFPYVDSHYPVIWPDCIYYSDDYFDKMHLSPSYGGHDNGVWYWGGETSAIYNDSMGKIQTPPIWLDDLSLQ